MKDFKRLLQNCLPKYQGLLVSNVQPIDFSLINLHFNWIVPGTWIDDALDEPETYDQMMNRIVLSRVNGNNHQEASYFDYDASEDGYSSIKSKNFLYKLIHLYTPIEYMKSISQEYVFAFYGYVISSVASWFFKIIYHLFFG